ncbi:MAG: hypothetical protein M0026_16965 [Nocardiopsaceae bacterium]|nr:hypothetical protein [Nocardiopsaceae bacterium]
MFAFVALGTATLVGLAAVGFFALRMLAELRRLREQLARTRRDVEPGYERLRSLSERSRVGAR